MRRRPRRMASRRHARECLLFAGASCGSYARKCQKRNHQPRRKRAGCRGRRAGAPNGAKCGVIIVAGRQSHVEERREGRRAKESERR